MAGLIRSSATIATDHAQWYLAQLCKHFGQKVPASFEGREGRITFDIGETALRATPETLMVLGRAEDPDKLSRLEQVIERHLRRFAFSEPDLAVDWRRGALA